MMEQLPFNIDELRKFIRDHAAQFQLNAHFVTLALQPAENEIQDKISFGKYRSEMHVPYPFYRPYSKVINIKSIV